MARKGGPSNSTLARHPHRPPLHYPLSSTRRGATDDQIFPVLLAYAQDTQALLPSIQDQAIIHEPVSGNIFARWYNIGPKLASLDNWEATPANLDGMYNNIILPVMRKNRDMRLIQYWNTKLANESAAASVATAAFSTDRYNQTRRPELLWSRAEDEIVVGMRDQALTEMYQLVKDYPSHPNAPKWIDELQGLLTAPAAAATGGTAPLPAAAH